MGLGVGAGVGRGAPLVAVVAFRATLGVPGSSRVWTVRGFGRACAALVHRGDVCTLPDRVGRVSFGELRSPTQDGIIAGDRPEVAGVVHLVAEPPRPDGAGVEGLAGELGDVAAALRERLARVAEAATVAQVSSVDDLTATVVRLLDHPTEVEVLPEALGGQVTAMVGVHPSLRGGTTLALLPALQPRFWVTAAAVERRQVTVTVRP